MDQERAAVDQGPLSVGTSVRERGAEISGRAGGVESFGVRPAEHAAYSAHRWKVLRVLGVLGVLRVLRVLKVLKVLKVRT